MDHLFRSDGFEDMVDNIGDDYLLALSLQALEEEFNSEENKNRKSNIDSDYELALSLSQTDEPTDRVSPSTSSQNSAIAGKDVVNPQLELSDPSPNIWHLMRDYDQLFFGGILTKHCIELSWSSRMTRTAGLCAWSPTTNYCSIKLSLPLLQLRSRRDLVETLIHEMIHALLFVTREDDNHESHGTKFHEHMYRINRESGANITVYHNFHDEVNYYLKHIWRCDGKCRTRPPYFGYVKRSMNRKPGPTDYWFKYHEQSCGGNFIKISEPTKSDPKMKSVTTPQLLKDNKDIRGYLSPTKSQPSNSVHKIIPFVGFGQKLGSNPNQNSPNKQKDIRGYLSPIKSVAQSNVHKVVPFSGFGHEVETSQSNNVSKSGHSISTKNSDIRSFLSPTKSQQNPNKTDPNRNQNSVAIDSKSDNKSIGNFNCDAQKGKKSKHFVPEIKSNDQPFVAFSGKGFVLGAIKKEIPKQNFSQKIQSDVCPPKKAKENIEVIEID